MLTVTITAFEKSVTARPDTVRNLEVKVLRRMIREHGIRTIADWPPPDGRTTSGDHYHPKWTIAWE